MQRQTLNTQNRSSQEWQQYFANAGNPAFVQQFQSIYGEDRDLHLKQRLRYVQMLAEFERVYGNAESIVIARAPGRVNLVGMHIDHQGGAVNPIAIKETRAIAQPRSDDQIVLANTDEQFKTLSFRLSDILPKQPVDWSGWTQQVSRQRGINDWSDYIKGAIIALQEHERKPDGTYAQQLRGMNVLVDSDLPVAAGLSSSSALVVATGYAVIACNDLHHEPKALIQLLGESEWYVGLRGGIGDHAVIILGRCGHLSHIQLSPISVEYAPFPADYRIVVCHSGVEAKKSADAQNVYNERVAGYAICLLLLKKRYPQVVNRVQRFRDLHPEYLGVSSEEFYAMLKSIPVRARRAEIADWLPEHRQTLEGLYQSHHEEPEGYRLRGVCLYGVAECERSRMALKFLRQGDIEGFGKLIDLSHEGDRISINNGTPFTLDIGDAYLERLMGDSQLNREDVQLYQQPGAYAASCKELDELVDLARRSDGVKGAGLIGAGLGGCVSVLVKAEAAENLVQMLERDYYARHRFEPFVEVCTPVAGASVF